MNLKKGYNSKMHEKDDIYYQNQDELAALEREEKAMVEKLNQTKASVKSAMPMHRNSSTNNLVSPFKPAESRQ